MNIKHAFLAILIGTSMVATADQIPYSYMIEEDDEEEDDDNWFMSCAMPCIAGAMVGLISGKISANICNGSLTIAAAAEIITEDKAKQGIIVLAGLSATIGTLIAENKLRTKCIDSLNQNFKDYRIEPNDLTKNSARIFSWITFLGIL